MASISTITSLINTIGNGEKNTAEEVRAVFTALLNETCKIYEVKELDVNLTTNPTFLTTNFILTGPQAGLGITGSAYEGFALCNGNNGTFNRNGRVAIGYDPTYYSSPGAIGGSENAVVVQHSHRSIATVNPNSEFDGNNKYLAAYRPSGGDAEYGLQGTNSSPNTGETTTDGVSGIKQNMQPYIVTIFVQRIA